MFSFVVSKLREEEEEVEKKASKNGVYASRVVPNGVAATTGEWEGGSPGFIHAGRGSAPQHCSQKRPYYQSFAFQDKLLCVLYCVFFLCIDI